MRTICPSREETHTATSAVVLLTLGVDHAAPSSSAMTRTPDSCTHDTIRLGRMDGGRTTVHTTSSLTAPAFDAHVGAYAFAIDARNTSDETTDWILGVELRSTTPDVRGVTLAASTTDGTTWSTPLAIDASGNPAICVVSPLTPSATQTVHFRVWVPVPSHTAHLSLEASTAQSSSHPERPRTRTRWLSRVRRPAHRPSIDTLLEAQCASSPSSVGAS